ncbi:hypothetical protein ACJJJB_04255 [Microbulbifer sp. ANSA001]|uniref:hypothetical protein n=1 Tax=Microbulbifer sp. ANSA001 TaxID=3243358 RepID=UPI004042D39A
MKNGVLLLVISFVSAIALAGTWTRVEAKLVEFRYSLPEGFGDTKLVFNVLGSQLTGVTAFYKGHKVNADQDLVSDISLPSWDSLNIVYEDIDDNGFIEAFSFCFYEKPELNSGQLQRYITYSLYKGKFYKEIIKSENLVRRCEPKTIK